MQTQTTRFIDTAFISSGGTKIIDGSDVLHVFTQPGTLTFEGGYGDAKVLLVGGGGSGGGHESGGHYAMGGGGAGGMVSLTGQTLLSRFLSNNYRIRWTTSIRSW